jgi:hypothetical protein
MDTLPLLAIFLGGMAALWGMIIFPISLSFKADRRKREFEHMERMKALEMGRRFPGEESKTNWPIPYQVAVSIGAGVPSAVFCFAWLTSMMTGYHDGVWIPAAIVGLGGVISGTVLAGTAFAKLGSFGNDGSPDTGKPYVADDAYDVVSARG